MAVQVTEAEWKIMEVLWDHSPRTMTEITAILEPETGWTRHTVITLLKRMLEKGSISMDDTERAKKYTPLITREQASTEETHKFLSHVFKGKASLLVNHLVDAGDLSEDELKKILDMIKDKKN
jgi:BlaI family penicillinase repressor